MRLKNSKKKREWLITILSPQKSTSTATAGAKNYGYAGGCGYNDDSWAEKEKKRKEEKERQDKLRWTPTNIKRKGDLPGVKVLNAIKKKIAAIAAGEYEGTLVDPDPKDTFEEKKSSTVK